MPGGSDGASDPAMLAARCAFARGRGWWQISGGQVVRKGGVELTGSGQTGRGLSALCVPAGLPVASRIIRNSDFANVDLHLQEQALIRRWRGV